MGDGTANLLKYALGLGAYQLASPYLPQAALDAGYLKFSFTRYASKQDISYHVEASSDLVTWTKTATSQAGGMTQSVNGGALNIVESGTESGGISVSVTDNFMQETGVPRFLRLAITQP